MRIILLLFMSICLSPKVKNTSKPMPERISKSATITLNGSMEKVFPLFGPIREKDWAEGWDPEIISSTTNSVEEHMIFRTKGRTDAESFYTWAITKFQQERYFIEYTVSTPYRIWFISVECKPAGHKTHATVTYTYIALCDQGNELNKNSLKTMFAENLKDWEDAINYYLANGKMLTQH